LTQGEKGGTIVAKSTGKGKGNGEELKEKKYVSRTRRGKTGKGAADDVPEGGRKEKRSQ